VAGLGLDRPGSRVRRLHREDGLAEYQQTPGNLGAQMWTRDLDDGRTEVLTLSWWESLDSIRGFAGDDIDAAVYYPEDEDYLIDREMTVTHYEVARRS
jgi:heme-degrading monooxygenase HmoA